MQVFIDPEIWTKRWMTALPTEMKLAVFLIHTQCDAVGVWEANYERAEFDLGREGKFDWREFREALGDNIVILPRGKWWIADFCLHQYPRGLDEESTSPPIKAHIRRLKKHGLWELYKQRVERKQEQADLTPPQAENAPQAPQESVAAPESAPAPADPPKKKEKAPTSKYSREFEAEFWPIYKKLNGSNKKRAYDEWKKHGCDRFYGVVVGALKEQIQARIEKRNAYPKAFIPEWKAPDTWVRNRCWEDEIEELPPAEEYNATKGRFVLPDRVRSIVRLIEDPEQRNAKIRQLTGHNPEQYDLSEFKKAAGND